MEFALSALTYAFLLVAGMLVMGEAGRRLALRRAAQDPEGAWHGAGVVDGAVFGLLGLVVAFTFSGAVGRFDDRRTLIVEETNAIGTPYLRLDLLPEASRDELRESFRQYLDSRIRTYALLPDLAGAMAELENSKSLQAGIWSRAVEATRESPPATILLLPALNQMFDITETRTAAAFVHPPVIIFIMLFGLALISAAVAGYGMARSASRDWFHMTAFAVVTAFAFYVILDIEYPRFGLIRLDAFDRTLVNLRESMG